MNQLEHLIENLDWSAQQKQELLEVLAAVAQRPDMIEDLVAMGSKTIMSEVSSLAADQTINLEDFDLDLDFSGEETEIQPLPQKNQRKDVESTEATDESEDDYFWEELSEDAGVFNTDSGNTIFVTEDLDIYQQALEARTTWEEPQYTPFAQHKNTREDLLQKKNVDRARIGRYLDFGLLGMGGMGEVRKVKDEDLMRTLAMKIIHPELMKKRNAMIRFIEEAQVCAQLQHPNTVPVYELGRLDDGRYYFTMKEIRGRELSDLISELHEISDEHSWKSTESGTSFRRLIQIFHQICETIAYSHSLGVVHRDLKPENVMLGGFGEVLVVDWGIAKVLGKVEEDFDGDAVATHRSFADAMATKTGAIAGTPIYMSPEQARGEISRVGPHSDIYSLGGILYEILSGRPPYKGTGAMDVLEKVRRGPPDPLISVDTVDFAQADSASLSKIPLPLVDICERAMARSIEDRYASAEDLAKEVFDWLEGAQKRDKGLAEIEKAQTVLEQIEDLEKKAEKLWFEADRQFTKEGVLSRSGWTLWQDQRSLMDEIKNKHRRYRQTLQGALVYDGELQEAHQDLAQLLIEDIFSATANGDYVQREQLQRQFETHLQFCALQGRAELLKQLKIRLDDEIALLHARRGSLVGRRKLCAQIFGAMSDAQLISLTGTAGVGKTRIALELMLQIKKEGRRAYFCDLTEAEDELDVARVIAKSIDLRLEDQDPVGQIAQFLTVHSTFLVLDKVEHIAEMGASVVERLLKKAPHLCVLVTSRIKLNVSSEKLFFVQPLTACEAMELFVREGQSADPQFELNASTRMVVGRLIEQLDRLPLAIELAAARLNVFSVDELERRLGERFSILRSRDKGTQALQGALDWSWGLLKPWGQAALSQISLFRKGFDVQAAEAVLEVRPWNNAPAIFDILQDLCEDSLLRQERSLDGTIRYMQLESIRAYAHQKLAQDGAVEQELSGKKALKDTVMRHARHYASFGQEVFIGELDGRDSNTHWRSLLLEQENLVAAAKQGEGIASARCCLAALKALGMRGPASLAVELTTDVLKRGALDSEMTFKLKLELAHFLRIGGQLQRSREELLEIDDHQFLNDKESKALLLLEAERLMELGHIEREQSVYAKALEYYDLATTLYKEQNNHKGIAEVYRRKGIVLYEKASYDEALKSYNEALLIVRDVGDRRLEGDVLSNLGIVLLEQGDKEAALKYYHHALEIHRELGDRHNQGRVLGNIGVIYEKQLSYKEAIDYFEQSLEIFREIGDRRNQGIFLGNMGNIHHRMSSPNEALSYYRKSLEIHRELGDKRNEGMFLGNIGIVYKQQGEYERSLTHYQAALEIQREIGNRRSEGVVLGNIGGIYKVLGNYESALSSYQQSLEIHQEIGNRRSEGIALGNSGDLLVLMGRFDEAKVAFAQAIEICDDTFAIAAGVFRGSMALINAQTGFFELDELLEKGESQVKVYPLEHAKFLCKKGQIELILKRDEQASQSCIEAQKIATDLKTQSGSELMNMIFELQGLISQTESRSDFET
ncbi:MAG: hypothetical protein CMK59_15185 [Proteobacteria bacterium]|nr:hypothetical protein [Pseudomonadota bacterium]